MDTRGMGLFRGSVLVGGTEIPADLPLLATPGGEQRHVDALEAAEKLLGWGAGGWRTLPCDVIESEWDTMIMGRLTKTRY